MEVAYCPSEPLTAAGYHISPALLKCDSPLLPAFYERVVGGIRTTVEGLSRSGGEKHEEFMAVLKELQEMEGAVYGNRS